MDSEVVVDMDADRSWQYNNAGVQLFISNNIVGSETNNNSEFFLNDALNLFRSALENKLEFERNKTPMGSSNENRMNENQVDYDNNNNNNVRWEGNVVNIKEIQDNFDFSVLSRCVSPDYPQAMDQEENIRMVETKSSATPTHSAAVAISVDTSLSVSGMYLHRMPFNIIEEAWDNSSSLLLSSLKAQVSSAIIVFNLGLVHQLQDKCSIKASLFYEIALALMQQQEQEQVNLIPDDIRKHIWLFELALVNNFAVWNHDNDNSGNADIIPYFAELLIDLMNSDESRDQQERQQQNRHLIEDQNVDQTHDRDNTTILLEGIRSNIQILLLRVARVHDTAVISISASSE